MTKTVQSLNERLHGMNDDAYSMRLLTGGPGCWYYVGPIDVAVRLVSTERRPVVAHLPSGMWMVDFYSEPDNPSHGELKEFARGINKEDALRMALGVYFAPSTEEEEEGVQSHALLCLRVLIDHHR